MENQYELSSKGSFTLPRRDVDPALIARCRTFQHALRLCITESESRLLNEQIAEYVGLSESHLSQCLNSNSGMPKHIPGDALAKLIKLCRNNAPLQWLDMFDRGELLHQRCLEDRERELKAELREIEKRKRA
jgi:AraC-like DNA-binding protein